MPGMNRINQKSLSSDEFFGDKKIIFWDTLDTLELINNQMTRWSHI